MSIRPIPPQAESVNYICAILERFPELASLRAHPNDGTLELGFAVRGRLEKSNQAALSEAIADHCACFLELSREEPVALRVRVEADRATSFVTVVRDGGTFSKDELEMLCAYFDTRFGDALVRSRPAEELALDEDRAAADEAAFYAVESLRDPSRAGGLIGFREGQRVLVYFLNQRRKGKASPRR